MHTWIDIATLIKKRNAQERFVMRCQANLLLCVKPGMRIAFVPPALDAPRSAYITDVTKTGDTTADVSFEFLGGPWGPAELERLIGLHCLALRDEIDMTGFHDLDDPLVGFEVVDVRHGVLGSVSEVVQNPGQRLLVVTRTDNISEMLIPYVDAIVFDIDCDARKIQVDLPKGLMELSEL